MEAILQDRQGFVWLGTWEGLARYDGYRFIIYKHDEEDPRSLSNDVIMALLEDQDGMLWVGTRDGGLNRFDPTTQTFTHYLPDSAHPKSIGSAYVGALTEDWAGRVWVGTGNGQLNRFDAQAQTFTRYRLACGDTVAGRVRRLLVDDTTQTIWAVSSVLFKFDPETEQVTCYAPKAPPTGPPVRLTDMSRGSAGELWLSGSDALYRFDPATGAFTRYHPQTHTAAASTIHPQQIISFNAIHPDRNGLVWIGSRFQDGVYVFDPRTEEFIAHYSQDPTNPDSFHAQPVWIIYEDREGLLWIGTALAGVDILDLRQTQFTYYREHRSSQYYAGVE
ncbi:MAG: hypothetical protein KatS3mg057_1409 [Herpetosiphonaceae bacterium]|nr:MAG: hypothetical protein KatS3mg057_1409 [Herpetosiphonaceae bacterium]